MKNRLFYFRVLMNYNLSKNTQYFPMYYNLCVVLFSIAGIDDFYITVLWGDCVQYDLTNEHLEELGKHAIPIEYVNWSIIEPDRILNYKIFETEEWKDRHLFTLIEEGTRVDWTQEDINEIKKKKE